VVVSEETSIRVFLLTKSRLLGEALARILKKCGDLNIVGATCITPQIAGEIVAAQPDILLSDTTVSKGGDIEIIPELRRVLPNLKVVLIGMELDKNIFLRAVKSGVGGYVLEDASSAEVAAAVRAVASNEAVYPPSLCWTLLECIAQENFRNPELEPLVFQAKHPLGLTRREQQLVGMIDCVLTNKEIASRLNLSEQTVKNHVHHMLRKAGASNRSTVVELCRRNDDQLVARAR